MQKPNCHNSCLTLNQPCRTTSAATILRLPVIISTPRRPFAAFPRQIDADVSAANCLQLVHTARPSRHHKRRPMLTSPLGNQKRLLKPSEDMLRVSIRLCTAPLKSISISEGHHVIVRWYAVLLTPVDACLPYDPLPRVNRYAFKFAAGTPLSLGASASYPPALRPRRGVASFGVCFPYLLALYYTLSTMVTL